MSTPREYVLQGWTVVSLGFNCFLRKYMNEFLSIRQETHFFDYIGSPMWAVCELIENDFADIDDAAEYQAMQVTTSETLITNKRYYLRFKHDFTAVEHQTGNMDTLPDCIAKYKRRAERFKNLLRSSKKILFVRLKEETKDRIFLPHDGDKRKPEVQHLKDLSDLLSRKFPQLETKFILIEGTEPSTLPFSAIVPNYPDILRFPSLGTDTTWQNCVTKFKETFGDGRRKRIRHQTAY